LTFPIPDGLHDIRPFGLGHCTIQVRALHGMGDRYADPTSRPGDNPEGVRRDPGRRRTGPDSGPSAAARRSGPSGRGASARASRIAGSQDRRQPGRPVPTVKPVRWFEAEGGHGPAGGSSHRIGRDRGEVPAAVARHVGPSDETERLAKTTRFHLQGVDGNRSARNRVDPSPAARGAWFHSLSAARSASIRRQRATLRLWSSSVSAKAWPPVPSATK